RARCPQWLRRGQSSLFRRRRLPSEIAAGARLSAREFRHPRPPRHNRRPLPGRQALAIKNQAANTRTGHTRLAKNIRRSEARVALEAIQKAVADASLTMADIDGMTRFDMDTNSETELTYMLGIPNLRFFAEIPFGGGGGSGTIALAAAAVASGQATNVVA